MNALRSSPFMSAGLRVAGRHLAPAASSWRPAASLPDRQVAHERLALVALLVAGLRVAAFILSCCALAAVRSAAQRRCGRGDARTPPTSARASSCRHAGLLGTAVGLESACWRQVRIAARLVRLLPRRPCGPMRVRRQSTASLTREATISRDRRDGRCRNLASCIAATAVAQWRAAPAAECGNILFLLRKCPTESRRAHLHRPPQPGRRRAAPGGHRCRSTTPGSARSRSSRRPRTCCASSRRPSAPPTTTYEARQAIHRVLHGADDRLLVVVGPCSIHDYDAAIDYATRLAALQARARRPTSSS